eukprot:GHVU01193596.1.p1 GENE.GHVU01193596.1~~GHVU01193596.1.p1  ORF type:complete len:108 (-),score=8.54 GHVU01193596.1:940-1263(-)
MGLGVVVSDVDVASQQWLVSERERWRPLYVHLSALNYDIFDQYGSQGCRPAGHPHGFTTRAQPSYVSLVNECGAERVKPSRRTGAQSSLQSLQAGQVQVNYLFLTHR